MIRRLLVCCMLHCRFLFGRSVFGCRGALKCLQLARCFWYARTQYQWSHQRRQLTARQPKGGTKQRTATAAAAGLAAQIGPLYTHGGAEHGIPSIISSTFWQFNNSSCFRFCPRWLSVCLLACSSVQFKQPSYRTKWRPADQLNGQREMAAVSITTTATAARQQLPQ